MAGRRWQGWHTYRQPARQRRRRWALGLRASLGVVFGLVLLLGVFAPVAAAHAQPVRMDPARDAILQAPPSQVRVWYSEAVNPATSRLVVVDTTNREVDNHDAHVSASDATEFMVNVPLLPAGTYVVAWRVQSADDGHVTGGSYIFRIAKPDGSVPPIPAHLPTGNFPGAGGSGSSTGTTLDGPTLVQAGFTWLALLLLAFWVGGVIWQTWIMRPGGQRDADLAAASTLAGRRFRRLAPYALALLLVADIGIVVGQSAELAGDWAGAASPPLLRAILFDSRFGEFWWLRQVTALAALGLTLWAARAGRPFFRSALSGAAAASADASATATSAHGLPATGGILALADTSAIPDWRLALLGAAAGVPRLPRRLVAGLRARTALGLVECALGLLLIVAFALSGHAAAVPAPEFGYALTVDLLHLLANAAWVGGLLYIGVVLMPVLRALAPRGRARVLALGLPEFGALAIVSALLLAATGSLNTTIHLTSIQQFLTTAYGRVLFIKIEFFLLMVAISAYHAFWLRPRLARELVIESSAVETETPTEALVAASGGNAGGPARGAQAGGGGAEPPVKQDDTISPRATNLARRLDDWLRREALLGALVLACVALLAAFAGTLSAPVSGAAPAASGPYTHTAVAGGYGLTLKADPAAFGTNTFTVLVTDKQGQPVSGAGVSITTDMLDMDMGQQTTQLQPTKNQPGMYSGKADLTMAGHWKVTVRVLPPHGSRFVSADFLFSANY